MATSSTPDPTLERPAATAPPPVSWRRAVAGSALAVAVFLGLGGLAVVTTDEIIDRSEAGFCRPSRGDDDVTSVEERTWWPLGERCSIELPDGRVLVRGQTWKLTVLAAMWLAIVAVGVVAPRRSTRRALAALVAIPAVVVATVVVLILEHVSLSRIVSITTISLTWSVLPAAATAVGVWWIARGRVLTIAISTWIGWAVAILLSAREGIRR